MDNGWKGVSKVTPVGTTPLIDYLRKDILITTEAFTLKRHLKRVGLTVETRWNFLMVSDADLMSAWLGNLLEKGEEVYDPDVDRGYKSLMELIEPPDLLIVYLGVKVARNSAMPEVLAEVLRQRAHVEKPTWVVDQPKDRLVEGHICWSSAVEDAVVGRVHMTLDTAAPEVKAVTVSKSAQPKNQQGHFKSGEQFLQMEKPPKGKKRSKPQ